MRWKGKSKNKHQRRKWGITDSLLLYLMRVCASCHGRILPQKPERGLLLLRAREEIHGASLLS